MIDLAPLKKYRGFAGLLSQNDGDQGDTGCRTGTLYTLLALNDAHNDDLGRLILGGFRSDLAKLTVSSGVFCRSPDPRQWYSWPGCFSRDQHSQLLLAAAALKDRRSLWNLTKRFFLRVGFHQNTYDTGPTSKRVFPDIMSPGELTTIIRGFRIWPLYPVLVVLDAFLCLDNVFRTANNKWGQDSLIAARLMYDLKNLPTPFTFLNRFIYKRTDYLFQIARYYTNENNNGIPPLGEIYIETAKEIIG